MTGAAMAAAQAGTAANNGGTATSSQIAAANDGNGADSDPSDPGDWTAANECAAGDPASNSSWHGTHVAGTVAAYVRARMDKPLASPS